MTFLLAIDQGTTGSTVVVLGTDGRVLGRATREFRQHFPAAGQVEHDVEEIWTSVTDSLSDALRMAAVKPTDCAAIGITNQRETTVLFRRESGQAIHRAIVWQDRRTAPRCRELRDAGLEQTFRTRTGLVLDPYFSGTKVEWLLDNVAGARAEAERGALAFGTIDTFLVHRLSGGRAHVTDVSNASRTLLFDIQKLAWDPELAKHLRVPLSLLPEVRSSAEVYARTSGVPGLPDGIPIAGIAGDQQAALFGQACFDEGDVKCTYGTGAFILMNTGARAVPSTRGLLTTVGWRIGSRTTYALEGSAFIAGAAVQWLRDGLGIIKSASEVEALARQVDSSGEVVVVPAFTGLGAPHWDPDARGLITGIGRDTTAAHIARATLEGVAFQIDDVFSAMQLDAGRSIARLRVDGGAVANALLMQFQCDLLGVPVDRPEHIETTALGAAYLAGVGAGVFESLDAVRKTHRIERTFTPKFDGPRRERERARWQRALERAKNVGRPA